MEEPLQYRLQRQDNQIGNLMGMLIELKEKLENAAEKKNSQGLTRAWQKKWSHNRKRDPSTPDSLTATLEDCRI